MNPFDAVIVVVLIFAVAMGFGAGLLRSLATIFGYVIAAPLAVALTPRLIVLALDPSTVSPNQVWLALFAVFIALGIILGALLRVAISALIGPDIGLFDRLAGAVLGAIRILLVAVLVAVVFDRVIPADHRPQFLLSSRLLPYLSAAGRAGLRSLPPEIEANIDRLKRERGL
jgi:membrane protein required for colicin V production